MKEAETLFISGSGANSFIHPFNTHSIPASLAHDNTLKSCGGCFDQDKQDFCSCVTCLVRESADSMLLSLWPRVSAFVYSFQIPGWRKGRRRKTLWKFHKAQCLQIIGLKVSHMAIPGYRGDSKKNHNHISMATNAAITICY